MIPVYKNKNFLTNIRKENRIGRFSKNTRKQMIPDYEKQNLPKKL